MVDYDGFAALRLGRIFPVEYLAAYPYYIEVDPGGDFDEEYQGGSGMRS